LKLPIALTDAFAKDVVKVTQWKAFVSRNGLEDRAGELGHVVEELADFLGRPLIAVAKGERLVFQWGPKGPWQKV
jgi:hypothetical protein